MTEAPVEVGRFEGASVIEGIVKLTGVGDNRLMESLYRRHRFPPEIISHAVRLYQVMRLLEGYAVEVAESLR